MERKKVIINHFIILNCGYLCGLEVTFRVSFPQLGLYNRWPRMRQLKPPLLHMNFCITKFMIDMDAPLTVVLLSAFLVCSFSLPTRRNSSGGHDGEYALVHWSKRLLKKKTRALPFAYPTHWTNFAVAMTAEGRGRLSITLVAAEIEPDSDDRKSSNILRGFFLLFFSPPS